MTQNYTSKSFIAHSFQVGKTKIGVCSLEKFCNFIRIRFVIPQNYYDIKLSSNQSSKTITLGNYTISTT